MLLYILVHTEPYEGDDVLGVYDSREAAINAAKVYYKALSVEVAPRFRPLLNIGEFMLNDKATNSIDVEWSEFKYKGDI